MHHVAPVDDKELQRIAPAREFRPRHKSLDFHERGIDIDGNQTVGREIVFPDVFNALAKRTGSQVDGAAAGVDADMDAVVDKGEPFELAHDVAELHVVALQELAARRDIEKELLHCHHRPLVADTRLLSLNLRAYDYKPRAHWRTRLPGFDLNLRNGAYRREGLPPETHAPQSEKVIGVSDFRRGMPLESHSGIGLRHPRTVVDNPYPRFSRILHLYVNIFRSGVDSILHKLLDHRCGTLYDFTGGYLVGHRVRQ